MVINHHVSFFRGPPNGGFPFGFPSNHTQKGYHEKSHTTSDVNTLGVPKKAMAPQFDGALTAKLGSSSNSNGWSSSLSSSF